MMQAQFIDSYNIETTFKNELNLPWRMWQTKLRSWMTS